MRSDLLHRDRYRTAAAAGPFYGDTAVMVPLLLPAALVLAPPVPPVTLSFPSLAMFSTHFPQNRVVGGDEGLSGAVPLPVLPLHLYLPTSANTTSSTALNVQSAF